MMLTEVQTNHGLCNIRLQHCSRPYSYGSLYFHTRFPKAYLTLYCYPRTPQWGAINSISNTAIYLLCGDYILNSEYMTDLTYIRYKLYIHSNVFDV
jgi:hypothetical protein